MFAFRLLARQTLLVRNTVPLAPKLAPPVRFYAKNKDKKKDGKKPAKVEVNPELLSTYINLDAFQTHMQKTLDQMKEDYVKNLSLRSTTGSIETLTVTVEGKEHELQELAQIVRKNPKTIVVNLVNFPQTIPDVLKAIERSGMNLNPQQDGTTLFIPVPKVTKEHREGLAKNAKALFIKCRDNIKDSQNAQIKKLKKQAKIPEDDLHNCQTQVTALADRFVQQAEQLLRTKEAELLGKE